MSEEVINSTSAEQYSANSIQVLEGLEAVILGEHLLEPLEGQRPHASCKEDGEEVADGVGNEMTAEDPFIEGLGALHDAQ